MTLNETCEIPGLCWNNIETLHKNIELDYSVIMPNHIHGIIIIDTVGDAKFASSTTDRTKMELSKVVQQFKRAVTIKIKTLDYKTNFQWQHSFYDRIIRNEKELYDIRKYIQQNHSNGISKKT